MRVLENSSEQDMVRHEAAEALGGIATPEVLPVLREWASREDAPRVVRESCVVALDMYEVRLHLQSLARLLTDGPSYFSWTYSMRTRINSSTLMGCRRLK